MRLSAPLYLFDQKDSSLKVVPLGSEPGQTRNNFYEINKINCLQDKHDVTL
jgi:hypothetical protein